MIGGGQQTFNQVLKGVNTWIPERAYRHEKRFQKDLQSYLDDYLNNQSAGLLGMGGGEQYEVARERGKARGDVVVNDTVGIELKRDLTNSQTKKLRGQIEAYLDNYSFVIACACGIKDMDGWRSLKNKYEGQQGFGMEMAQVKFVHKRKKNFGKASSEAGRQSGGGLFGGGLLGGGGDSLDVDIDEPTDIFDDENGWL